MRRFCTELRISGGEPTIQNRHGRVQQSYKGLLYEGSMNKFFPALTVSTWLSLLLSSILVLTFTLELHTQEVELVPYATPKIELRRLYGEESVTAGQTEFDPRRLAEP